MPLTFGNRRALLGAVAAGGGAASGPAVSYTANYLPNVGTAPKTWGMKANGDATLKNLFRVVKNDNTASLVIQNVGAPNTRPDLPDLAAIAAFIGATWDGSKYVGTTTCKVDIVYEQVGGVDNLLQTTHANRPAIDLNQRFNDVPFLLFDGQSAWGVGAGNAALKYLTATLALTLNQSVFWTGDPLNSYTNNAIWSMNDATGLRAGCYLDGQFSAGGLKVANNAVTPKVPRSQPTVIAYRNNNGTTQNWIVSDVEYAGGFPQTLTPTTMSVGYNPDGGAIWGSANLGYGRQRFLGITVYPAELTQANQRTVHDGHITMFNLGHAVRAWVGADTATFTKRDVYLGDSIAYGFKSDPAYSLTAAMLDRGVLANREFYNVALSGDTCASQKGAGNYNARVQPLFTSAYGAGNCRLIIQTGVNDIASGGATQASLASDRAAINTLAAADGFRVGTCSLLPTTVNGTTWTAGMEAVRTGFNGGGANTFGSTGNFTVDVAANSNVQTTTDTAIYADGLHLTLAGQVAVAPTYEAAAA